LEHNDEALLFSFTHSSEKENKSVLVNEHLQHTYTLKQPHSHKDHTEREREREREREYLPSDLTCLLQTQSSSGFCKTSKKPTEIEPQHTKHHFSQKQKQQKNVTQNQSTQKLTPKTKQKKLPQTKHKRNLNKNSFFLPQKQNHKNFSHKPKAKNLILEPSHFSLSLSLSLFLSQGLLQITHSHYITII